jgi:hypothetical protein
MAKDKDSGVQEALDKIGRGEQPSGYCVDFDRNPPVFPCGELEEAVAKGDVSLSWNGDKAVNLKSGDITEREADRGPRGVAGFTPVTAGGAPAAGGDTVTTDNSPPGGGGGGGRTART